MTPPVDPREQAPAIPWAMPFEKRAAARAYRVWMAKAQRVRPEYAEENQRLAINAAYSGAAILWMFFWVPFLIVSALSFSTNRPLTIIFAIAAALPATMFFMRIIQAIRSYYSDAPQAPRTE